MKVWLNYEANGKTILNSEKYVDIEKLDVTLKETRCFKKQILISDADDDSIQEAEEFMCVKTAPTVRRRCNSPGITKRMPDHVVSLDIQLPSRRKCKTHKIIKDKSFDLFSYPVVIR